MQQNQLPRVSLLWQLLAIIFAVLPHLAHLPLWVPLLIVICLGWRYMVYLGRWSFPQKIVRAVLVMLAGLGVAASYKFGGGISSTVTLLVTAFGLKTLEMYKQRDALVVIYVAYLVTATSFLFDQSILMAAYVFLALIICTAALFAIHLKKPVSFLHPLKSTFLFTAPTIPLMVVLFLVVPRIGPLWEIGLDQSVAKTGLSDQMSPGDITQLTRSAEVAFRVEFNGAVPQQNQLYWRAIVMNDFDGRRWFNSNDYRLSKANNLSKEKSTHSTQYTLIMEPSGKRYVPVLEQVKGIPSSVLLKEDMTVNTLSPIKQRTQYNIVSQISDRMPSSDDLFDLQRQLILPDGNSRARQLAQELWQETPSTQAYLREILKRYNQSFVYTLKPKALGIDGIDRFLFDTQEGFCGHFSSATAFLLRAAGIPARIVTGYQGGEWNPYERYLLVRQYDAHAWVEYWTEESGWRRVDPTAFVAPERVEQPADEILANEEQFLADNPVLSTAIISGGFLSEIRLRMEAINYGWHRWVLGYHHHQIGFLSDLLGSVTPLKIALFLLIPFAVVIFFTTLFIVRKGRGPQLDACDKAILILSNTLKKQGLQRNNGETVKCYCQRIAAFREDNADLLTKIAYLYESIRYAGQDTPEQRRLLISLVNQCQKSL